MSTSRGTHGSLEQLDRDFVELLTPQLPRLRRMARVLARNAESADDLVGEAIARTLPKWRAGRVDDVGAYVRRVVVNLASRRWRRRSVGHRLDHTALDWLHALRDAPHEIVEEIAGHVERYRDRWGIGYLVVRELDAFAPAETIDFESPVEIADAPGTTVQIAVESATTCNLLANGRVACLGSIGPGQIDASSSSTTEPVIIKGR